MKVVLQQDVRKLGKAGDIVETKPGYFRNFLQPRKMAVLATVGTLKKREEDLEVLRKKAEQTHQTHIATKQRVDALPNIQLHAKVGEGGKLYGKITSKEIAQALEKELSMEVDKRTLKLGEISALGTYKVQMKLAQDVQAECTVEVLAENAPEAAS